jgi:hypothetical protein
MSETPKANAVTNPQIPVHFVKSTFFRVIHADGVWFGGDPNGNIHLAFFNERQPIPEQIVATGGPHGIVEDESQRVAKDGVEREIEIDVVLSFQTATFINNVLGENLKNMREALKSQGAKKT